MPPKSPICGQDLPMHTPSACYTTGLPVQFVIVFGSWGNSPLHHGLFMYADLWLQC